MNYNEALTYIHANFWQGSKPGLSRTKELLKKLGDPQDRLKFIHVAGTNGKGSFCSMLTSILLETGLRVGTYTSPYILRFNERMKVNGKDIPDETLARLTETVRPLAESMEEKPTEFELITAIAMEYFYEENCDIVVLECGMGGRLDSTNVIQTPILSVITGIAMDHTAFLGDTVEKIAEEKAGIIKPAIPILFCGKDPMAKNVIEKRAVEVGAPLFLVDRDGLSVQASDLSGTVFSWKQWKNISLPLLGLYQTENAQNVLTAVDLLRNSGFAITEEQVVSGLGKTKWPARYEVIRWNPVILCDGGHNPEGIDAAVTSTKQYFGSEKVLVVTGVMADKDYPYMVSRIAEIADQLFCIKPDNPRALDANSLAKEFLAKGVPAVAFSSIDDAICKAIECAKAENKAILCVGSLYMYSQILNAVEKANK